MNPKNPYENRWRWWYSAIADWMIANPGGALQDCATALNKSPNTISLISNTDMFRDYLSRRKAEWRERHDFAIVSKVTQVAEASLDILLEKFQTKGAQIPIDTLSDTATGMLDRLGYGPKQPAAVQVNNHVTDARQQTVVVVPVSAGALEEARDAMRLAEQRRAIEGRDVERLPAPRSEAELEKVAVVEEDLGAALTIDN